MHINEIENHRLDKIKSLLTDQIANEVAKLFSILDQSKYTESEIDLIEDSLTFAANQDYGTNILYKYYVGHPIRVAQLCALWLQKLNEKNVALIQAALIHNALEKEVLTPEQLETDYDSWIRKTIVTITVDRDDQQNADWAHRYYTELSKLDKYGQMLKVFDKFDNIYALCLNSDADIRKSYLDEIEEYILPVLSKHAPFWTDYFNHLIDSTRRIGHRSIESYMKEFGL